MSAVGAVGQVLSPQLLQEEKRRVIAATIAVIDGVNSKTGDRDARLSGMSVDFLQAFGSLIPASIKR